MGQTGSTKLALERDEFLCQWCYHKLNRIRHIFTFIRGYHSAYAGGHHAAKRSRVDEPDAIIALCSECHFKVEHAIIPKIEIYALLSKIVGYDIYQKYRWTAKWDEEEWNKVYP